MPSNKGLLQKLFRESAFIFLGTVVGTLVSFGTRFFSARHLGTGAYGEVVVGITVLKLSLIVVLFGFEEGIARELPRADDASSLFVSSLVVSLPAAVIIAGLMYLLAPMIAMTLENSSLKSVLRIFALAIPIVAFVELSVAALRGLQNSSQRVIVKNFSNQAVLFFVVLIMVSTDADLRTLATSWPLAAMTSAVVALYFVRRTDLVQLNIRSLRNKVDPSQVSALLVFSLPLLLTQSMWKIIEYTDNIFLVALISSDATGAYDAAFTLARPLLLFIWSFEFIFLPIASNLHAEKSFDRVQQLYTASAKWMSFLTLPALIAFLWRPELLLSTIFGPEFAVGWTALVVMAITMYIRLLLGLNWQTLIAFGRTDILLKGNVVAVLVNIAANLVLIPRFGLIGAALASGSSYVLANCYWNAKLFFEYGVHPYSQALVGPLVGSVVVSLIAIRSIEYISEPPLVVLVVGVGLFTLGHLISIIALGGIEAQDRELLGDVLGRIR